MTTVNGTTTAKFDQVRQVFARQLSREVGASVCVWHNGEIVVDLWGGFRDRAKSIPWDAETISIVFSATKGVVAVAMLMLVDRGLLDLEREVAAYWPEFAANGKSEISVRTLLNHRAGLITVDPPITLEMLENEPALLAEILARQAPQWSPGTDQGYHGVTFGLYVGELFRRVAGVSVGRFIADEIAGPLGADFFLGIEPADESRVAEIIPVGKRERLFKVVPKLLFHRGTEGRVFRSVALGRDSAKAFSNPRELGLGALANFNTERVHHLELPWCSGIGNARGLSRIYAAVANGGQLGNVHLFDVNCIESLKSRQSWSECDRVLCKPVGWSQGFLKEEGTFSPNRESFGHSGAGGSLGWCDPVANIAIGYVMNQMDHHIRSPRAISLCQAVYACL